MKVARLISGGQTGADQGGLAAAVVLGLGTGGWAPAGYLTEVGPAPWLAELGLREGRPGYRWRTRANVQEAAGTVLFGNAQSSGSRLTREFAEAVLRPLHHVPTWALSREDAREDFLLWLADLPGDELTLNVAGNRESRRPGLRDQVRAFLVEALACSTERPEESVMGRR